MASFDYVCNCGDERKESDGPCAKCAMLPNAHGIGPDVGSGPNGNYQPAEGVGGIYEIRGHRFLKSQQICVLCGCTPGEEDAAAVCPGEPLIPASAAMLEALGIKRVFIGEPGTPRHKSIILVPPSLAARTTTQDQTKPDNAPAPDPAAIQFKLGDDVLRALTLYRSHKSVRASKITDFTHPTRLSDQGRICFAWGQIKVPDWWLRRHRPAVGGYFVAYEDGYTSYSPEKPFEEGYTRIDLETPNPLGDAVKAAWGLIANASGGDWSKQSPEWVQAAERWRDKYLPAMSRAHVEWSAAVRQEAAHQNVQKYGSNSAHNQQAATVPATSPEALRNRYSYHAPKGDQAQRYEAIRAACLKLSLDIVAMTPGSPEQSRALNALDQVMFLANAAIARRE